MAYEYKGMNFLEPADLSVRSLGFLPRIPIEDGGITSELGRDFLGPDEVVALIQVAVARAVDYRSGLTDELHKIQEKGKAIPGEIFRKNLTGIGRGHSLDGLPVIALGVNGTKMIDSALTGVVYSRSLVTSGRRREAKTMKIAVPDSLKADTALLDEYIAISTELFEFSAKLKERFPKRLDAIQAVNKFKPYNDPADLFYVLPLSSIVNLAVSVDAEKRLGTRYLPEECALFVDRITPVLDEAGMGQLFRMRKAVPRETYLHYNVFRAPESDYASAMHEKFGNPVDPVISRLINDLPEEALEELAGLRKMFTGVKDHVEPGDLYAAVLANLDALSTFSRRYNKALNIQTLSNVSWRVWSEQKRHGTLSQHVESIYSASKRALMLVSEVWDRIEKREIDDTVIEQAEKAFVISPKIKEEPELLAGYIYHTSRQIMFYGRLLDKGLPARDALYIVPRNIRVRTLEDYDLMNATSLEMPLRLCTECEPERRAVSEKKAELIKENLPELAFLIEPKCNLGYCSEGKFCRKIMKLNPSYNLDIHTGIAKIISDAAR